MAGSLPEWLDVYGTKDHGWQCTRTGSKASYTRRIGIVESLFDVDGTDFEGRADLCVDLHVELRTALDERGLRDHIEAAWAVLRHQHTLLSAKAVTLSHDSPLSGKEGQRAFVFDQASSFDELKSWGRDHIAFVADHYEQVDAHNFYQHLMNASRVIDPLKALAKAFVLPFDHSTENSFTVNFIFVFAHQIADGLTVFRWASSFIDLINKSHAQLKAIASDLCSKPAIDRLPPPQEALYHPIKGNIARQRWFWAITRILRHKKRTNSAAFQNPLRRQGPPLPSKAFPPNYHKLLRYDRPPPLNVYAIQPTLSRNATHRLMHLCRQSHISFGSGLFTLVAIVLMSFEERLHPSTPLSSRLPFIGSFPINPRPFLSGPPTTGHETSLMLAFSDGITLPFLPSTLPFEPRFRLLGKQAHRQLRQYQKRRDTTTTTLVHHGTKSPTQLLPQLYLSTLTRLHSTLNRPLNIQGAYPAASPPTFATCGISSVGDRTAMVSPGKYDVSSPLTALTSPKEVAADFRDIQSAVRAREDEFLCGAASDGEKTYFMISVDGCAIDMQRAEEFKRALEGILEEVPDSQERKGSGERGAAKL